MIVDDYIEYYSNMQPTTDTKLGAASTQTPGRGQQHQPQPKYGRAIWLAATLFVALISVKLIPPTNSSPQAALPQSWLTSAASGKAPPKMNTAPLVQLDTGGKYYKILVDGMMTNFKKAIDKASGRAYSLSNATSSKPIRVIDEQLRQVLVHDLHIEGLANPKVSNIYVNKKNLKLHATFNYKTIKLTGRCTSSANSQQQQQSKPTTATIAHNNNRALIESTNWSTSWSASVLPMVGREHFDLNRVYTTHNQQRLSLNLKDCPQNLHDKLKAALVEHIKAQIEARLVEIMETVMIHPETLTSDDQQAAGSQSSTIQSGAALGAQLRGPSKARGKRASSNQPIGATKTSSNTNLRVTPAAADKTKSRQTKLTSTKVSLKKPNPILGPSVAASGGGGKTSGSKTTPRQLQQTKSRAAAKLKPKLTNGTKTTGAKGQRQVSPSTQAAPKGFPIGNNNNNNNNKSPVAPKRPPSGQDSTKQKVLKRTKRQTPCQQGEELDDYVDQLFRFGTRIVRAMEPVTLPNATIELPDYNLKIFLYEGKGTRAYKFRRTKAAWVYCSNETISLGITIELEELRVNYKYRVISGNRLLFDGDLEARLSPRVQAQFSQQVQEEDSEEPVQQRIDRIRVFRLGRVQVLIRGLGNLTQTLSLLINGYLNDNQEELQPTFRMVEGDAVRFMNRMLANVNVPLLSVV